MLPLTPVVAALLASVPLYANAQLASLVGTWSSGSQKVQTGPGFATPSNASFKYPPTAGISYSFAPAGADGQQWFEVAQYRFVSNGTQPNCIVAVMNWFHGTYEQVANGSIVLTPNGDGYQQIQDPCAATSNFIENFNKSQLLPAGWYTYTDPDKGLTLQLYQFDGSPLAPMAQISSTPNMLPTQQLRNVTPPTQVVSKRSNGVQQVLGEWTLASTVATVVLAAGASML